MKISCKDYTEKFPAKFPLTDNYGNVESASTFALNLGHVEVTDEFHLYHPPHAGGYPRFDNVPIFLWSKR